MHPVMAARRPTRSSVYSPQARLALKAHLCHQVEIHDFGNGAPATIECVPCRVIIVAFEPPHASIKARAIATARWARATLTKALRAARA